MAVSIACLTILAPSCSSCVISRSSVTKAQPRNALFSAAPQFQAAIALQSSRRCSFPFSPSTRTTRRRSRVGLNVVSQAKSEDVDSVGAGGVAAIGGGLIANPVVWWSLYTLKTTGCGLPPGPGGSIGAIEGVSYLAIAGVIGWSVYTKVRTGSGLPQGPFGLLGAVEGFSFLTILAIVVVFGLQALDFGFIPGPLPGKECFGS
jgi:hypothetical protein